ncbi:unnamed protein product [Anisakis simplex]|uniref:Phage protein n=1 Tax=Anisakis simplex TaxID=6269 RepID=A0A0M3KHL7_ANISI|nr:unnamed protein product [Anisakis simplex]
MQKLNFQEEDLMKNHSHFQCFAGGCEDGEDCELCRLGNEYNNKYDKAKGKQKASDMIMKDLGVLDD